MGPPGQEGATVHGCCGFSYAACLGVALRVPKNADLCIHCTLCRSECPSAVVHKTLEAVRVHLTGRDLEDVPVRARADDLLLRLAPAELECLAQSREVHLNVLDGIRRRTLSPKDVDQPIDGNDLIPVQ